MQLSIRAAIDREIVYIRAISLLTKDEHQDRHSGQTGEAYGERHCLADDGQGAKDKIADTIRLEMRVLQLENDRAVGCHAEIHSLRVSLFRSLRAAGAESTRLVARKLKAHTRARAATGIRFSLVM